MVVFLFSTCLFFHLSICVCLDRLVAKTPCHTSDFMGQFCQNSGVQATVFNILLKAGTTENSDQATQGFSDFFPHSELEAPCFSLGLASHFSPMYLLLGLLTPPLLQSEQAQLSQSLPSLPCSSPLSYWLSMDSLKLISILVPGEPKLDTGLHTWSSKCWIMGNNHFTYWLYSHWRNPEHRTLPAFSTVRAHSCLCLDFCQPTPRSTNSKRSYLSCIMIFILTIILIHIFIQILSDAKLVPWATTINFLMKTISLMKKTG